MSELAGCVYCEKDSAGSTSLCCSRHVRLVCDECREGSASFRVDHPVAA